MNSRPASLSPQGEKKRTGWPYQEGRYLHMVLHEITSSIANTMRLKKKKKNKAIYRSYEIKPQEDFQLEFCVLLRLSLLISSFRVG